jgi:3D (Asp-Asp-Asp) domain-containing protein
LMDEATGLIYIGNGNYYDPATGRFLNRDANPNNSNPYVPFDPMGALFAPLGLTALVYGSKKKGSKWAILLVILSFAVVTGMTLSACGPGGSDGNGNPPTVPPGTPTPGGSGTDNGDGTPTPGAPSVTPISCPAAPTTPGGVLLGDFLITHYTMSLESDPAFQGCDNCYEANIPIWENGKIEYYKHNNAFVYGLLSPGTTSGYNWGVLQEGTGITLSNKYISLDPNHKTEDNRTVFTYQEGGACVIHQEAWLTVAAHDPSILPCGSKVTIDEYPGRIFTVTDTGSDVGSRQLDVFVGPMNKSDFETMFATPRSTHFSTKVRRAG